MGNVLSASELEPWRSSVRQQRRRLVVTNGCFDILHVGHLRYLASARSLGDILLVGINDDAGVQALKGPGRPLNPAAERAELLAALVCVDAVAIFEGMRANEFFRIAQPDIYVKGGDYTIETLDAGERELLLSLGAKIEILPLVPGKSTSRIVESIRSTPAAPSR